jgi:hypothetical protein
MANKQKVNHESVVGPKQVYEVIIEHNNKVVFDKAVSVRRHSELNGIANQFDIEVGDVVDIWAKRVR